MIFSLTSLRFLAALMVVFSHLPGEPFREGYSGVTFFFVLSGFILAHRYSAALRESTVSVVDFWIGRFARIYPLHLLTALVALPAALEAASTATTFLLQLLTQLTLTQAVVALPNVFFSFNAPSWSLSVEAFFYALFPVLVKASTRRLAAVIGLVTLYHLVISHMGRGIHYPTYIFPPARLGDFVLGILLFRLHEQCPSIPQLKATLAQAASACALAACYGVASAISQALRYDIFYAAPMGAVIFTCAWQNGLLARALATRWLVFLGDASFALYLVHQLVIRGGRWLGLQDNIGIATAYLLTSVTLAAVIHVLFEAPARVAVTRALRRIFAQSRFAPRLG